MKRASDIEKILSKYAKDAKPNEFKSLDQLKDKQVTGALESYAKGCKKQDIIALMDITLFESGKNGFIITANEIYSHEFVRNKKLNGCLKYADIKSVKANNDKKDYFHIAFTDGTTADVFGSIYAKLICKILKNIVALPEAGNSDNNVSQETKKEDTNTAKTEKPAKKKTTSTKTKKTVVEETPAETIKEDVAASTSEKAVKKEVQAIETAPIQNHDNINKILNEEINRRKGISTSKATKSTTKKTTSTKAKKAVVDETPTETIKKDVAVSTSEKAAKILLSDTSVKSTVTKTEKSVEVKNVVAPTPVTTIEKETQKAEIKPVQTFSNNSNTLNEENKKKETVVEQATEKKTEIVEHTRIDDRYKKFNLNCIKCAAEIYYCLGGKENSPSISGSKTEGSSPYINFSTIDLDKVNRQTLEIAEAVTYVYNPEKYISCNIVDTKANRIYYEFKAFTEINNNAQIKNKPQESIQTNRGLFGNVFHSELGELKSKAKKGNAEAQYQLYKKLKNSESVKEQHESDMWLSAAAKGGCTDAMVTLAKTSTKIYLPEEKTNYLKWMSAAAEKGSFEAQKALASYYYNICHINATVLVDPNANKWELNYNKLNAFGLEAKKQLIKWSTALLKNKKANFSEIAIYKERLCEVGVEGYNQSDIDQEKLALVEAGKGDIILVRDVCCALAYTDYEKALQLDNKYGNKQTHDLLLGDLAIGLADIDSEKAMQFLEEIDDNRQYIKGLNRIILSYAKTNGLRALQLLEKIKDTKKRVQVLHEICKSAKPQDSDLILEKTTEYILSIPLEECKKEGIDLLNFVEEVCVSVAYTDYEKALDLAKKNGSEKGYLKALRARIYPDDFNYSVYRLIYTEGKKTYPGFYLSEMNVRKEINKYAAHMYYDFGKDVFIYPPMLLNKQTKKNYIFSLPPLLRTYDNKIWEKADSTDLYVDYVQRENKELVLRVHEVVYDHDPLVKGQVAFLTDVGEFWPVSGFESSFEESIRDKEYKYPFDEAFVTLANGLVAIYPDRVKLYMANPDFPTGYSTHWEEAKRLQTFMDYEGKGYGTYENSKYRYLPFTAIIRQNYERIVEYNEIFSTITFKYLTYDPKTKCLYGKSEKGEYYKIQPDEDWFQHYYCLDYKK